MKHCLVKNIALILALFLIIPGTALSEETDKVIATVNGQDIMESQLEIAAIQSKVNYKELSAEQRSLLTNALINRQLVLQQAQKEKFDQKPAIVAELKALTESYIAATYLTQKTSNFKVTEEDMKAYYDQEVAKKTPNEYKARHILVKTEQEAKDLIKRIQDGADFSELALKESTDLGSGKKGGDLGWFTEHDMVAPFSRTVAKLQKGELGKTPIKSQFGWHVIILDDIRSTEPPSYINVKSSIRQLLLKNQLNDYLIKLNTNASVQLK
jgi:peptidyl-prolyl cis-trans isomerase C